MTTELARRDIYYTEPITIIIEPDDWRAEARRFCRPRVVGEGWSDAHIHTIVHKERQVVNAQRK
jgi:hypothetical protein